MSDIKIINEEPVPMAQVHEELGKIKDKTGELNFRANKTFDYLNEFSRLPADKSAELKKKIEDLSIPRLKEEHIVKILDTLPQYPEEVKSLLSGYTLTLSQDNAKKIGDVVAEYVALI